MPAAARPVPQAAQPSELFFPNGHAVRRLIRYIYSTFKKQWPSRRRKKNCTFSQHAAIANQRPMAPRSFCEQARNTTRHSRVAVSGNVANEEILSFNIDHFGIKLLA